ncbi:MAG TPA: alkaline phosphatase family protein, partial [Polyangiaceae bacterium]
MAPSSRQRLAKYGLLLCAQLLALLVFALLSRAESGRPPGTRDVPLGRAEFPHKLAIVFVDSLSDRVARDVRVMPHLHALAESGVALEVTPCRDQLTYLCLRALLTGYDESSLLALRGNFSHDKAESDNLLDRLAEAGRRVAMVGSHDFEPYQSAQFTAKFGPGNQDSERRLLSDLAAIDPSRQAEVTIFGFSNGDRTAHAFGTANSEYSSAFSAIDDAIGQIASWAGRDTDLFVFGDHGHDEMGRHLPGLASTTYAVYAGPSFRHGVELQARLTDHRAILGALLGVPTPPSYTGPDFARIFAPGALNRATALDSHELVAPSRRAGVAGLRWILAGFALIAAIAIGHHLLDLAGLGRALSWLASALAMSLMALAGAGYDVLRQHIHDHGSEPERSFYLLVP